MFTTRPELRGSLGMVSSTHWLASAAGLARLEAGGNAFDAAVAAGFTLQVAEPHLNGPGGEVPVIFAGPDTAPTVLCAQGTAPAGATIEHYRGLGLELVPGSGLLAAAIPGATAGWLTLLRDRGTARLREVLDAAIGYAATGVPVLPSTHHVIATVAELFRDDWTTSAALWLDGGAAPAAGSWLRNPAWAATLQRLVTEAEAATSDRDGQIEHALDSWREGFVAEAIDAFARTAWRDSSGQRHAGVLTAHDIATWRPSYEPAVMSEFHGWTVCKTGPWGQGPVLLQQLALLDELDAPPGTAGFVHTVVEASKLAFADREAWYGDGADTPLDELLSPGYTAARRALIGERADLTLRPGSPGGRRPVLPDAIGAAPRRAGADVTTAEPTSPVGYSPGAYGPTAGGAPMLVDGDGATSRTGQTRGDTCHVSVADRWGNLVAAMPSGGWLQSSPAIDPLGFCLGTRLQMTWLQPGLPASLAPGRRPRTTLSPSLALRDGRPALAFGSPGGDQQDQWQLTFFLNHVLGGMNLQESIDAASFHSIHFPSSFYPRAAFPGRVVYEDRFDETVLAELRRRGHELVRSGPWSLGRLCAVGRDPDGRLRAAANPRAMQGYAAGR